jgi:hypothetical protein
MSCFGSDDFCRLKNKKKQTNHKHTEDGPPKSTAVNGRPVQAHDGDWASRPLSPHRVDGRCGMNDVRIRRAAQPRGGRGRTMRCRGETKTE